MRQLRQQKASFCLSAAALAVAVGVGASFVISALVRHSEAERLRVRFEQVSTDRITAIEGSLESCIDGAESIRAILEFDGDLNEPEFHRLAQHFLDRQPYLVALQWVPMDGAHCPVRFSEPSESNRASLGLDYASDPMRREAMQAAMEHGRAQATRPVSSETAQGVRPDSSSVQIFIPVYATPIEKDTPAGPARSCRGFLSAVFRIRELTEYALAGMELAGVDVSFYEFDMRGHEHLLYTRWSRLRPESESGPRTISPAERRAFERDGYLVSHPINVAGLSWWVSVTPAPGFFNMFESPSSRLVLLIGMAISVLIGYVVLVTLRALLSREERARLHLAAVVESSADAIYTKNMAGVITSWNHAAERLLGWRAPEIIGRSVSLIQPGTGLQESSRLVEPGNNEARIRQYETVRIAKTGKPVEVSLSVSPIKDERGIMTQAAVIIRDITDQKRVERMKDDFIHLASHQLRTPLSALRLYSDMLLEGYAGDLTREQTDYLRIIATSTQHMIDLVGTLLNISRIDSAALMVRPEPCYLGELLIDVLNELETDVKGKQLKLEVQLGSGLPLVAVDPVIVHEILINLMTNAIKYTPAGGAIDVDLSLTDDWFVVSITDTGCGIAVADHSRVFSRFYRAENVRGEQEGSGMGLYLVKSLCELSECQVAFESEPGKGSTFCFSVPRSGMKERAGRSELETSSRKERLEHV